MVRTGITSDTLPASVVQLRGGRSGSTMPGRAPAGDFGAVPPLASPHRALDPREAGALLQRRCPTVRRHTEEDAREWVALGVELGWRECHRHGAHTACRLQDEVIILPAY